MKVKRFCRPCNNVWMNSIENEAQPMLKGMFDGRSVDLLNRATQEALAKWIIKTAMVFEFMTALRQFADRDRCEFRRTGLIPEGHSIFLAAHREPLGWPGGFVSYGGFSVANDAGDVTNACAFTLGIDHFICQVIGSGKRGGWVVDAEHPGTEMGIALKLWPPEGETLSWPPRFALHPDQVMQFAEMPLPKPKH
jgi:hypothetical protein